jgi:phage-related protein
MNSDRPLQVVFYRLAGGREPVRDWLKRLSRSERKSIGEDIKTVQFGWPLGMPLVRQLESDLWEVRSNLKNRTARVIFTFAEDQIVLLHGFIKKTQKTPKSDLALGRRRRTQLEQGYEK